MIDQVAYLALLAAPEIAGLMGKVVEDSAKKLGSSIADGMMENVSRNSSSLISSSLAALTSGSSGLMATIGTQAQEAATKVIGDALSNAQALVVPADDYQHLKHVSELVAEGRLEEAVRAVSGRRASTSTGSSR